MCNFIKTLLALLLATATLSACTGGELCDPGDTLNLDQLEEAAKQNKLEEVWGEPKKSVQTEGGRIEVYSFWSDGGCLVGLILWGLPIIYPSDLPSTGYFTTEYDANGSFKSIRVWRNADSPGEAAELHLQSLADEEARAKETAECETVISEAVNLDRDSLLDLKVDCEKALGPEKRWMLTCLLAHQGDGRSRFDLGISYHYGQAPGGADLSKALLWYTLAKSSGYREPGYRYCYHKADVGFTCDEPEDRLLEIRSKLTDRSISEVDELVTDWQPNPPECESISNEKAGSTQPD